MLGRLEIEVDPVDRSPQTQETSSQLGLSHSANKLTLCNIFHKIIRIHHQKKKRTLEEHEENTRRPDNRRCWCGERALINNLNLNSSQFLLLYMPSVSQSCSLPGWQLGSPSHHLRNCNYSAVRSQEWVM